MTNKNIGSLIAVGRNRWKIEDELNIIKAHTKTAEEKPSNLLEAFRSRIITVEDLTTLVKPIQVRFA